MGMFDNIICSYPLPLTDELKALNIAWEEQDFQTKCLDCSMAVYKITVDGSLLEEVVEREYVLYTEEERKTASVKSWNMYKEVIEKNRYHKPIAHHGTVTFYTSVAYTEEQDFWVEFVAYFVYGKLDKIELFKAELMKSYVANIREWEEHQKSVDAQPWNWFKRTVRPLGWHWFWLKAARTCGSLYTAISKIQSWIYRKML